ncbi:asparaginase [Polymorphum gilvum]|uniref:L-asparaginase, thermolabile subfamily n=1 Tax=Polymorphum gilvum (strain LMG 25793 / CGMCC 1.9160 / SL003B-26A1) TaxID=991905 RepID=F2IV86_POLGS|nr:asparaginase [Polymorphum gilvum]ADZ71417.1 L-asparaginase, thermolabile subfamily [Polymorphum gilvum SL003B-26A1]
MANPVLVEVTRGALVESRHRGALAIVDAAGRPVLRIGDVAARVFPRSAIKALQALPLVESGAADALDLDAAELALACSSHNGEPVHVNAARVMLIKAGLDEDALECGPQWPARMEDVAALCRADEEPCQLHNNCSGKHAGFLGLARAMGVPTRGYVLPDHPVQREIRAVLEAMTGDTLTADVCGTDGCSIPTYASPLEGFARAFAAFGTGEGLEPLRAAAARRLYDACVSEPFMVAGTDRFCTKAMQAFDGRVFVKTGAEGVFCAALPDLGYGIALKCDDGAGRAAEVTMAAVLEALLDLDDDERTALDALARPELTNRRGLRVGAIRPSAELLSLLRQAASA